jgi:predicted Zn-ribbon and HTH transcriptional regulator
MVNRYHVSDILSRFIPAYKQQHGVSYQQAKSCQHIMDCQTARLGSQQWQCNNCGYEQLHYCSCRDRHCPRCQGKKRQQWLESQQSQVINTQYFYQEWPIKPRDQSEAMSRGNSLSVHITA